MTTSGTTSWTQNRDQIILRAGRQVGAWFAGETPSSQETQDFNIALNAMVKAWESSGIHLWAETEGILFPVAGQIQYSLGSGSADHAANMTGIAQTTLSSTIASGATSLSVASIAGFANAQIIGVYLATNAYFWTTISGTPSGSTIPLASGLSGAANVGAAVFAYTSVIDRPLRVLTTRRYQASSGLETPINVISRLDYRDLPNKTNSGLINQVFYDPQLNNGQMWLWQNPSDASYLVKFTYMRQLQDFNNPIDTPDFPQEWVNTLTWNLAKEMMTEYGVPEPRAQRIMMMAEESLDRCMGFDREPESVLMGYNSDWSSR